MCDQEGEVPTPEIEFPNVPSPYRRREAAPARSWAAAYLLTHGALIWYVIEVGLVTSPSFCSLLQRNDQQLMNVAYSQGAAVSNPQPYLRPQQPPLGLFFFIARRLQVYGVPARRA